MRKAVKHYTSQTELNFVPAEREQN